jgi:hypothetical protein
MKQSQMKKLLTFTNLLGALALISGLSACATTAGNNAAISMSQKEMMLGQSGFVSKTVTTPKQQQQVEKLPVGVVSAVKFQGKLFYVYPTTKKDQVFVGRQTEYNKYKGTLQAQAAKAQQANAAQSNPQAYASDGAYLTGETAGPNRIIVQEFDGFGPIQDQPEWQ